MQSDIQQFLALRESLLQERAAIEAQIKEITGVLDRPGTTPAAPAPSSTSTPPSSPAPKQKWKMSAAARSRSGAAAKARWAKIKGTAVVAVKKPTRKISAAGREEHGVFSPSGCHFRPHVERRGWR